MAGRAKSVEGSGHPVAAATRWRLARRLLLALSETLPDPTGRRAGLMVSTLLISGYSSGWWIESIAMSMSRSGQ